MDLAALEPALATLAASLTGVEASCCVWENAPRPRHNGRLVALSWISLVGVGIDETEWTYAAAADPLEEMTPSAHGPREAVFQLAVEVTADQRPGQTAAALAERARTRLRWPSSLAALQAAGVALATVGTATQADYTTDQHLVSRALFEVRLNAADEQIDTAGRTSHIATVSATGTVTRPDGTAVPATLQPTTG